MTEGFILGVWVTVLSVLTVISAILDSLPGMILCSVILAATLFLTGFNFGIKSYEEKMKKGEVK